MLDIETIGGTRIFDKSRLLESDTSSVGCKWSEDSLCYSDKSASTILGSRKAYGFEMAGIVMSLFVAGSTVD